MYKSIRCFEIEKRFVRSYNRKLNKSMNSKSYYANILRSFVVNEFKATSFYDSLGQLLNLFDIRYVDAQHSFDDPADIGAIVTGNITKGLVSLYPIENIDAILYGDTLKKLLAEGALYTLAMLDSDKSTGLKFSSFAVLDDNPPWLGKYRLGQLPPKMHIRVYSAPCPEEKHLGSKGFYFTQVSGNLFCPQDLFKFM